MFVLRLKRAVPLKWSWSFLLNVILNYHVERIVNWTILNVQFFIISSDREWKIFNFTSVIAKITNIWISEKFWGATTKPHINSSHQSSSDSHLYVWNYPGGLNQSCSSTHVLNHELVGPLHVEHCVVIVPHSCQFKSFCEMIWWRRTDACICVCVCVQYLVMT